MNFKTPFKVLTTAALIGTLSLSAVAPGAASAAEKTAKTVQTKAELAASHIVLEDAKGNLITLDYNTYLEAKSVGIDLGAEPISIKVGDKFYNLNDFLEAKSVSNNNLEEAVKLLDKNDLSQDITPAEGTIEDGKLVVVPGDEDFTVTEIAAINSKQVKVTFSKSIPAKQLLTSVSAGTVDTDAIKVNRAVTVAAPDDTNKNVTTVTGEVSKDGKSIILTASGATYFDGAYAVTVSDKVEDKTGKKLTAFAGTVKVEDTVAPTVESVEFDPTSGKIVFTTSEPVALPTTLRINGTPVTGLLAVAKSNNTKFEFAKPESVKAGEEATVYLAGSKDYAGNILEAFNGKVTIADDQSTLQVAEVKQVSSNKAAIVFNKPLKSSTLADTDITALIDGKALTATTDVTYTVDSTDVTGKTVIATFNPSTTNIAAAPTYFYGTGTTKEITFVVADKSIEDVYGQKIATTTKTVTLNKDVTGPTAVSATLDRDGKGITIQLDEVVSGSVDDAVTLEALRVNGVAGALVAVAGTPEAGKYSAKLVADEKGQLTQIKVTKGLATALETIPSGTVQVRLAASAITDVHTNASKAISQTVTVNASTTDLEVVSNGIATAATNNHFTVEYNQAVTAASALNKANYTLDGKALPEGTDIYFDSATPEKKVHIILPTGSINIGSTSTGTSAQLAVANVKTESGKTVKSTSGTVTIKDNTSATVKSVSVVGNIVYVKFDEKLAAYTSATALNDFAITVDNEALSLGTGGTGGTAGKAEAALVSGQEDTVAITITPAVATSPVPTDYVASNWNNAKKIEVSYKGTGLTDANLFTVAASKAPVANK